MIETRQKIRVAFVSIVVLSSLGISSPSSANLTGRAFNSDTRDGHSYSVQFYETLSSAAWNFTPKFDGTSSAAFCPNMPGPCDRPDESYGALNGYEHIALTDRWTGEGQDLSWSFGASSGGDISTGVSGSSAKQTAEITVSPPRQEIRDYEQPYAYYAQVDHTYSDLILRNKRINRLYHDAIATFEFNGNFYSVTATYEYDW